MLAGLWPPNTATRIAAVLVVMAAVLLALLMVRPFSGDADSRADTQRQGAVIVDEGSIGGRCDDRRTATAARSARTPLCSLDVALEKARGSLIHLRSGAYPDIEVEHSGTTIAAFPGDERPSIGEARLDGIERGRLLGLHLRRIVVGATARDVSLVGNRVDQGILLEAGARGVEIDRNRIAAPSGDGVLFASSYGRAPISDVTIRRNKFADIGRVGVNARNFRSVSIGSNSFTDVASFDGTVHPDVIRTFNGGSDLTIRGNIIRGAVAQGIFIKDGQVDGLRIENNVMTGIGGSFWAINIYDVRSARIVGNTVWDNNSGIVFQGRATDVVLANNILQALNRTGSVSFAYRGHNLIGSGDASRTTEVSGDPRFVDPGGGDYRLGPRSPAIDTGTSEHGTSRDRDGSRRVDDPRVPNRGAGARPYYDLGAYERP